MMQGSTVGWCWGDAGIAPKPGIRSAAGHAFTKYHHDPKVLGMAGDSLLLCG